MRVRPMRGEDIGRVADLRIDLFEELDALPEGNDTEPVREAIRSFLERRLRSGGHFTSIVEEDGHILGVGSLEVFERLPYAGNLSGKEGYVLNIYVEPSARKRGVAGRLVADLVDIARGEGIGRLWLHPSAQGRRIYESAGFESRDIEEMQLILTETGKMMRTRRVT